MSTLIAAASAIAALLSALFSFLMYRGSHAPQVVAYAMQQGGVIFLAVENAGSSPAYDVGIRIGGDWSLPEPFDAQFEKSFAKRGIAVLVAGSARTVALGPVDAFMDRNGEPPVARISFKAGKWRFAPKVTREYPIDVLSLASPMCAKDTRRDMEIALAKAAREYANGPKAKPAEFDPFRR